MSIFTWDLVVDDPSGCWLWTGSVNQDGYGVANIRRPGERGTSTTAHRVAYQDMVAEIPAGLELDHECRVRLCVNPYHLDPVTPKVNSARAQRRVVTHCPQNHPYDAENTYVWAGGNSRQCRACLRRRCREYGARRRAARAAA